MSSPDPSTSSLPTLSPKNLSYKVHKYSSYSSTCLPENILEDRPKDHTSRWSSEANTPPQYLTLKLENPSVVTKITFGKFEKTHVCNLKRFKVYGITCDNGGEDDDNNADTGTILLIDSGLKNDSVAETFRLRHVVNGHYLPFNYIKIMPIQSWGPSFNFSIWYVALEGDESPDVVKPAMTFHDQHREKEAIRLCLKHFRQKNYTEAFDFLQKKTNVKLEDSRLTDLHKTLVIGGDYEKSEALIAEAIDDGLFDDWMNGQQPVPKWSPLILPDEFLTEELSPSSPSPTDEVAQIFNNNAVDDNNMDDVADFAESRENSADNSPFGMNTIVIPSQPGSRGGHQMVMDSANQSLYLFGGWDGNHDLSDFWVYHVPTSKWRLLSMNTEADGGPSSRSCHKMVLDTKCGHIFVLGRYLERGLRERMHNMKSDFYMYDIASNKWTMITDDTSAMGGPPLLIFDHQMCIDVETRILYVFGGQSLFPNVPDPSSLLSTGEKTYSGLYGYHIPTNTWTKKRDDVGTGNGNLELKSRSGHSMLFHNRLRKLFVFGGQRKGNEYLNDFFSYNVDLDVVDVISTGSCPDTAIPPLGHTQRATIDQEKGEIHVMTGLNKDKEKSDREGDSKVSNSFWVYNIGQNKWTCFYRNENDSSLYWNEMQAHEPRPRYAHQLVYDESNRVHFMFGGNPGGKQGKENRLRLGDFWKLHLQRPNRKEVVRRCNVLIRQCKFTELAKVDTMTALNFLHTCLASIIDHDNPIEEREYQLLASELFSTCGRETSDGDDKFYNLRNTLFERLSAHFPDELTHPRCNLIDMVPYTNCDTHSRRIDST